LKTRFSAINSVDGKGATLKEFCDAAGDDSRLRGAKNG
jgi:hypothetical protein